MNLSQVGLDLIKGFETCVLHSYYDQGHVLTIGYGHTGKDVFEGQTCTQGQADQWLANDAQKAVIGVVKALDVVVTQNQFDAMVDLAFNIGVDAFSGSHLVKYVNAGHALLASDEFVKWDHVHGQVSLGLLRRRQAERDLFLKA